MLMRCRTQWKLNRKETNFICVSFIQRNYNTEIQKDLESKWRSEVLDYIQNRQNRNLKKKYVLSQFPYPSGNLHMGHVRVYTISDALARYYSMKGFNVIHPMGWDAFGLPAENAAFERNENPHKWTTKNIERMKKQLKDLSCSFDWSRELVTCRSDYYKWTQFIFLKLFEAGLAYKGQSIVNWDPIDKTVLAHEQVDDKGRSWRTGAVVEKKSLNQWFIRTTRFSSELYDDLNDPSLKNWRDIANMQRSWIGKGRYVVHMKLFDKNFNNIAGFENLSVYMEECENISKIAFFAIKSSHSLNRKDFYSELVSKDDFILLNLYAKTPLGGVLPVVVSDNFKYDEECDIYIGYKDVSEKFCKKLDLNINSALNSKWNFKSDNVSKSKLSKEQILDILKRTNSGEYKSSPSLQDWLISRQRYWGTPIPIINCSECGNVPVPIEDLPVILPTIENREIKKGANVLREDEDWFHCSCPKCGKNAVRETDTMDTFVDSSWYFLRFLDPQNEQFLIDKKIADEFMPVDIYIGGKEHALLHLYYARFMHKFLRSIEFVSEKEPFRELLVQGMVKSESYQVKNSGKYLPLDQVDFSGERNIRNELVKPQHLSSVGDRNVRQIFLRGSPPVEKSTGSPLNIQYEKMSKSKFNGVDPELILNKYGSDIVRLAILSKVGPQSEKFWDPKDLDDSYRFLEKLWNIVGKFMDTPKTNVENNAQDGSIEKLFEERNLLISRATMYFENSMQFHCVIRSIQQFLTFLSKTKVVSSNKFEYEKCLRNLILMLAPVCPHICAELWMKLNEPDTLKTNIGNRCDKELPLERISIFKETWPKLDSDYKMELRFKVNETEVTSIKLSQDDFSKLDKSTALKIASETPGVTSLVQKIESAETNFKFIPGYNATLSINTMSLLEIRKMKKAKRKLNSTR